ncbi:MAG TPA: CrcB family protein [Jiangellaceae bacterium]
MGSFRRRAPVIAAVAAGGVLGAEARYALTLLQGDAVAFPWVTFVINVVGCVSIGVLMVVLLDLTSPHRLARPFLGVGVLGGFTTFSTYAVDIQTMLVGGRSLGALGYLALTPVAALAGVWAGAAATRALIRHRRGDDP